MRFCSNGNFIAVTIVIGIFVRHIIERKARRSFLVINPRFDVGDFKVGIGFIIAAKFPTDIDTVTRPAEVLIADADHA